MLRQDSGVNMPGRQARRAEILCPAPKADGLPNKEVAYRLGINQRTVESHRARGMQKLGASSLAELVRFAVAAEADGVQIFPQQFILNNSQRTELY